MKRTGIIIVMFTCAVLGSIVAIQAPGCSELQQHLKKFEQRHPELLAIGVDETGDGLTDVFYAADADDNFLRDPNGNKIEVAGTRAALTKTRTDDTLLASESKGVLNLFGFPVIAAAVSGLLTRWKLNQRIALHKANFADLATSVQVYRDVLDKPSKDLMNEEVGRLKTATGNALNDVKAEIEAEARKDAA